MSKISTLIAIVLLAGLISLSIAGDDANTSQYKSRTALGAEAQFRAALSEAEAEFARKQRDAQQKLKAGLTKAMDEATKAGDLDDALKIRERIREIEAGELDAKKTGVDRNDDRARLYRRIVNSDWSGKGVWSAFRFNANGTVVRQGNLVKDHYWAAVDSRRLVTIWPDGAVDMFELDDAGKSFSAYAVGRIGKPSFTATLSNPSP